VFYAALKRITSPPPGGARDSSQDAASYFPPPDSQGGWRTPASTEDARRLTGVDVQKLDEALAVAQASTKNGGLLVVRKGWLVYERYFGLGHREAMPNLASCGKSFTSIAMGMLMAERPELFPDGLDQKVYAPAYLPSEAFPLSDPAKAEIKLGQLLAFTAGIRGNNPCFVRGKKIAIDPAGPDGWPAMLDAVAVGHRGIESSGKATSTKTLWCDPGEGYSYSTASAHLVSMIVRHVSGMELEAYIRDRLVKPIGFGPFTFAYQYARDVDHTPGGGGIAVRATDMVRFGYLLLRQGRWADKQIVPAEYVRQCGRASSYNPHSPYSLQFDVNTDGHIAEYPRDAFWKSGSGAHMLYVVPSLDLVVWKLAGRDSQYQERDTGVKLDAAMVQAAAARREWSASLGEREGQREVLAKVIAAIGHR
jgi:CubicO group peptidase (beta-lactamase class C family)